MNPLERKAALALTEQAIKGGWSGSALADVLGALGLVDKKRSEQIVESLGEDPDPNYDAVCPAGIHPARGNVYRARDRRIRCTKCSTELKQRREEQRREAAAS